VPLSPVAWKVLWPFSNRLTSSGYNTGIVGSYIERKNVSTLYIDDAGQEKAIIAYAAVHPVGTRNLLKNLMMLPLPPTFVRLPMAALLPLVFSMLTKVPALPTSARLSLPKS